MIGPAPLVARTGRISSLRSDPARRGLAQRCGTMDAPHGVPPSRIKDRGMARSRKKLGEILVEWGALTPAQAEQGVKLAKGSGKRLGEALVEAQLASDEQVAKALAKQFQLEYIELTGPN